MALSKKDFRKSKMAEFEQQLQEFAASSDIVLALPSWLNSHERMQLHDIARQVGIWGQSFGKKKERTFYVFQPPAPLSVPLCSPQAVLEDLPADVTYVELDPSSCATLGGAFTEKVPSGWTVHMNHVVICRGTLQQALSYDGRSVKDPVRQSVHNLMAGSTISVRPTSFGQDPNVIALGVLASCDVMTQMAHIAVATAPGHSAYECCALTEWDLLPAEQMLPLYGVIREPVQGHCEDSLVTATSCLSLEPPLLVRGKTGLFENTREDIAANVVDALQDRGWSNMDRERVLVEDVSGHGCSRTYRVACNGAVPSTVALHVFEEKAGVDSVALLRIEKAAEMFARVALAPHRLAHGCRWFLEQWGGVTLAPTSTTRIGNISIIKEIASLLVQIHSIGTEWYDECREEVCIRLPELRRANVGSHVWWFANAPRNNKLPRLTTDGLNRWVSADFFAPHSPAAARVVTCHGDFHPANILRIDGFLKTIDFEFTGVASAVHDVAYAFDVGWVGTAEEKRAFVQAYLETSSQTAQPGDVDAFLLDAEIARLGRVLWPGLERRGLMDDDEVYVNPCFPHAWEQYVAYIEEVRCTPSLQQQVMEVGLRKALETWFRQRQDREKRELAAKRSAEQREEGLRRQAQMRQLKSEASIDRVTCESC